jgi:quercetin dioxygenase-like cupin family protein
MFSWMLNQSAQREWSNNAVIIPPNENEQIESHGNKLSVIVPTAITNNQFWLYDIEMEPNARGPKLHYHRLMDETFIIREGTLTVLTAEGETDATAGTVIFIPRLTAHGYNNDTGSIVKITMIFNPGYNREQFFRTLYKTLEENPHNTEKFQKLYIENDSYSLNSEDMIPLQKGK